MNILPTGPHWEFDRNYDRYFRDLARWNFDIAYNAYYAFPLAAVLGEYKEPYQVFTERARREGVPSCVQIQSVVANIEDIPLTETQRYADNSCHLYEHFEGQGKQYHFGSFASRAWLDYLKNLTTIFREYGFDWVVYEEPMFRPDIPGTEDRFYQLFRETYPHLDYPTRQDETPQYLAMQKLKRDTLVRFYGELASHAKGVGFEKMGVMPWFFTPTFENTPSETWATCCDTGRITFLPDLDFIVVRMQPDNIYAQVMAGAGGESVPTLAYYECMAHALGKPIIMVNNPTDEHKPEANRESTLIPYSFFRRYTLSAAAAAPQGMSRHWYGKNYDDDPRHMDTLAEVNALLRRLAPAACDVAFVFSYSGTTRPYPRPWRDAWASYWSFARCMVEQEHLPFLTFFAETLPEAIQHHPEVRTLVLNENFPLPEPEVEFLEQWVRSAGHRRIVYFGGRSGYRWSGEPPFHDFRLRPPEMASLFGVDTSRAIEIVSLDPRARVSEASRGAGIMGKELVLGASAYCRPQFSPDVAVDFIYVTVEEQVPVITRRRFGKGAGEAWFVGISLEGYQLRFPFRRFFDSIGGRSSLLRATSTTQSVFYNQTSNGYFVVSNCSIEEGKLELAEPVDLYDVAAGTINRKTSTLAFPPLTCRLYRIVGKGQQLLDVEKCILFSRAVEEKARVTIQGEFHQSIVVHTTRPVIRAMAGKRKLKLEPADSTRDVHRTKISHLRLSDRAVTLAF